MASMTLCVYSHEMKCSAADNDLDLPLPFPHLTASKLLHSITTELIANLHLRVQLGEIMKQPNNFSSVRRVESDSVNKEATDNDLHSVAAKAPPPPGSSSHSGPPNHTAAKLLILCSRLAGIADNCKQLGYS
ncbi:hypothetical protein J6590_050846 [Homalodisca vitripennis]|nr:hypothetical protein J6590_050846 [Homalodisca vitripennis]